MAVILSTCIRSRHKIEARCDRCNQKTVYLVDLPDGGMLLQAVELRKLGWIVEPTKSPWPFAVNVDTTICPECRGKADKTACEHDPEHPIWHASGGDVRVCKMGAEHLDNAIAWVESESQRQNTKVSVATNRLHELISKNHMLRAERSRRFLSKPFNIGARVTDGGTVKGY